jgi:glycosyltransferase involved in cell wall biosynthesis
MNTLNSILNQDKLEELEEIDYEVIVVEQVDEKPHFDITQIYPVKHIVLKYPGKFNKSWCMNVGAREASFDNLVFMDAETLFGRDYLIRIKDHIFGSLNNQRVNQIDLSLCWSNIICLQGRDNPICRYVRTDHTRTLGGVWYCSKSFYFIRFGGMNEGFFGYGGEDNEAYYRAKYLLGDVPEMNYYIVHQYHDWSKQSESATDLLNEYKRIPQLVIDKLVKASIGDRKGPKNV